MKKLQLAIMAATLVIAVQARASLFELNYTDTSVNTLSGLLSASPLSGGQYLATGGSIMLSTSYPGLSGLYSLASGGPINVISPSGQFQYDNILYYPGQPIVDFSGVLAFKNSSTGVELNLFSTSSGYALYAYNGNQVNLYPGPSGDGFNNIGGPAAIATLTAVPEASTMIAGALLLLPFGASTLRKLRNRRI
jgi:hypothetical protein